jgi:hypothetical protein
MSYWFGEPWPADWRKNGRAPVCEDDAQRVETPVGDVCLYCEGPIGETDQGILMPYVKADRSATVSGVHILCLIRQVIPDFVTG